MKNNNFLEIIFLIVITIFLLLFTMISLIALTKGGI